MTRVAVIGAGHWGPNLIRNFHDGQTSEVTWVVDLDAGRLEQVHQRFPELALTREVSDALEDPSVDAVAIATPTATHYALARAALRAGKHVLIEKPITSDARQADELCELAEAGERVLMVGHVFLFNSAVRRVKELLDEESLGRIYYLSMVRTNLGPIRTDVNAAWDLAAHDISISNYWLDAQPLFVSAVGASWINPDIEDAVFATLRYPNGVLVNLHTSWLSPRKARDITLVGERKMLTFDDMNLSEPIRIYDKYVSEQRSKAQFVDSFASFRSSVRDGDIWIPKVAVGEPLKSECEHFLECIENGRPPLSGGRLGASVVRVLEAVGRSTANAGREEPVEP